MLDRREQERAARQISISGWGEEGQVRLRAATVGIIGAGGLGSTILMQLAVAGVGRIIVADPDEVELSNLNRQVLHWHADIGRNKAESAADKLGCLNPGVEVEPVRVAVDQDTIEETFGAVDALVDALDCFPARYAANAFAVARGIPFFHGAVWGLEGRATTIVPGQTPCLRCIYPELPAPAAPPPVAGVTPALIGAVQACDVIKYFTGLGELLAGRLLVYDGLGATFLEAPVAKRLDCPVCGRIGR